MSSPKLVLSLFFYSFLFFCYGSVPFYLLLSHNELILCAIKVSLSSYKLCQPNIGLSNSLERMISAGESFEYIRRNIIANYGHSLFVCNHIFKSLRICDENTMINETRFIAVTKVIIEKSHGEGSLMEQDTIENVSQPNFLNTF